MRNLIPPRGTHSPRKAPAIVLAALLLAPSNCPADQSTTSPTATEQATAQAASQRAAARKKREAACEKKLRAAFRLALTDPDDPAEANPPVPPVCRTLSKRTQKRIARKVIFSELGAPCPAERFPDDCEAAT